MFGLMPGVHVVEAKSNVNTIIPLFCVGIATNAGTLWAAGYDVIGWIVVIAALILSSIAITAGSKISYQVVIDKNVCVEEIIKRYKIAKVKDGYLYLTAKEDL